MSVTKRITGLVFLLLAVTVGVMIWLTDWQMTTHFQAYVTAVGAADHEHMMGMYGVHELAYLSSVHRGLAWVGAGMLIVGLAASYVLARGISEPLRRLCFAVAEIQEGKYGQKVEITTGGELASLAEAFNSMSDRLATNEKLRKRLLADIAHELRTPITIIQGNLEGMIDGIIEPNKAQLISLYEEAVHLSRLIKDLRDLSLANAGHLPLEKTKVSLLQLAGRSIALLNPIAEEKGILLSYSGSDAIVEADPGRTTQIIQNLLSNALRYARTRVTVTVTEEDEWAEVAVADDGPGIPPEHLPHIFDQFYRIDEARDRQSGGSGIGLAIVKSLVEAHGGTVSVHSVPGEGTTFMVRFKKLSAC
ncbi:integral membrane sensor signal transduction histidine kinase [Thermosinus carboxydivorans Nor1]|uniref:histidine kinase n=1 Tax=Thermosinus carboxydivorans Nor1 TaxID=401526 RepID=A1HNS7_9FIRM|nr:HAMP domain-containing sensor histidine kinase [Thermosinus carboxydivorans]EAX48429.1 integral membrane sensor signal transduction histidine kinase [Thermosinus carboxydivorans Nor1]